MGLFPTKLTVTTLLAHLAVLTLAYGAGVALMPRPLLLELLNGMLAVLTLVVAVVYSLDVPKHLRSRRMGPALIRIGISGAWSICCAQALGRFYIFELRPDTPGRLFDATAGAPAFGYMLFAALHLVAIGMQQTTPVRRNLCMAIWPLLVGAAIVLAVRGLR